MAAVMVALFAIVFLGIALQAALDGDTRLGTAVAALCIVGIVAVVVL